MNSADCITEYPEPVHRRWQGIFRRGGIIIWNLFLLTFGSVLCAVVINGLLIPHEIYGAGFTGIALLIHYLVPRFSVAAIYFLINIPVFAVGWINVGRRFFFYSIAGMLIFTVTVNWVHIALPVEDKMLSALFAGIVMGTGSGIILKSYGSAGGLDVLSIMILKRFSVRLGTTILLFNAVVISIGAVLFSLQQALYTLIFLYVNAQMVNLVVTGLSQRKAVMVISPQWNEISRRILDHMGRGVTIIPGRGAYTGQTENILYAVITFRELAQLKRAIRDVDPDAFVVVTDTLEVMNRRIGNQPHW